MEDQLQHPNLLTGNLSPCRILKKRFANLVGNLSL